MRAAGVDDGRGEALLLLTHALGATRTTLLAHPDWPVAVGEAERFAEYVARRARREPFAYIVERREFYGRSFSVDRRVLVPRPETETLVEQALVVLADAKARGVDHPLVVDVGTGSGAIGITIALEAPWARLMAVDSSADALAVAQVNRRRLGPATNVGLVRADLLACLGRPADLIVANLPYIPSDSLAALMPEVSRYEPRQALDGGPDGTRLVRRLIDQARALLNRGGALLVELDPAQIDATRNAFGGASSRVVADLAGLPRVLRLDLP